MEQNPSFTKATVEIKISGDLVATLSQSLEQELERDWEALRESITNNERGSIKTYKQDIYTLWKHCLPEPADLDWRGALGDEAFLKNILSYYAQNRMWSHMGNSPKIYILVHNYITDTPSETTKIKELLEEGWLDDLMEEYGREKLKSIRINQKKSETTP